MVFAAHVAAVGSGRDQVRAPDGFYPLFCIEHFAETTLGCVRHLTDDYHGINVVQKILKMPNRGSTSAKERTTPGSPGASAEHIIHYPRLQRGLHYADLMRDERLSPEIYHCVIQREGSNEIFSWTQHSTLESAMKNAEVALALVLGSTAKAG